MGAIRRGNRHGLNTVRAGSPAAKQTLVVGVTAIGIHPQLLAELAPAFGINIKAPASSAARAVIAQGGRAVNIADLAAAAAADHAPAQARREVLNR